MINNFNFIYSSTTFRSRIFEFRPMIVLPPELASSTLFIRVPPLGLESSSFVE